MEKNINIVVSMPDIADHTTLPVMAVSKVIDNAKFSADILNEENSTGSAMLFLNIRREVLYM